MQLQLIAQVKEGIHRCLAMWAEAERVQAPRCAGSGMMQVLEGLEGMMAVMKIDMLRMHGKLVI
jgi:hypothetical protein